MINRHMYNYADCLNLREWIAVTCVNEHADESSMMIGDVIDDDR